MKILTSTKYILAGLLIAGFALSPFFANSDQSMTGTDDQAADAVTEIRSDYKPWFSPLWRPNKNIEGALFSLQAALGAGIIGYYIGFMRGKASRNEK